MKSIYLKNLLISLIILSAWTAIILFIGSGSQTSLDYGITLFTGLWLLRIGSLIGAGIVFLLRITRQVNKQTNLFYFFFATANFLLGAFGILLLIINPADREILHSLLPNLLIGILLFTDIFFFNILFKKPYPPDQS